jgi:hypothetical protein
LICNAAPGCGDKYYDGPTGIGTPNGVAAFKPGAQQAILKPECEPTGKPSKEEAKKEEPKKEETSSGDGGSKEGELSSGQTTGNGGSSSGGEASGAGSSSGSPGAGTTAATHVKPAATHISALALTANARTAVRHTRPTISKLAFSCKLSLAAKVRVTLMAQVRSGHHTRWHTLPSTFTFAAIKGLNSRHLRGSAHLAPGLYRLTLTPAGGAARSISIRIA